MEYAIRDITIHARQYEKSGRKIIYLNIGDPVKYDFPTPDHIKKALIDAILNNFNYYADSEGILELRQAIVKKESLKGLSITVEDVLVTNGISEGLDMVSCINSGTKFRNFNARTILSSLCLVRKILRR